MIAADVMTRDVITIGDHETVRTAAATLLANRISAVPVVGHDGRLVGIVSEGDLVRRAEISTERRRSWWLQLLAAPEAQARDFIRAHAVKVADVMTRRVVTAAADTPLEEIATLLEKHGIKRVPIVEGGEVVGIVSRRNILQAFMKAASRRAKVTTSDAAIRDAITDQVRMLPWGKPWLLTVSVVGDVVELWGPVDSEEQRTAIRVAAEATPGVSIVTDHLYRIPAGAAV